MARNLILTQDAVAIVDDADFEWLNQWKWTYNPGIGYAYRNKYIGGKRQCIYLHRLISEPMEGQVVDHINKDKLDNRRSNLRNGSQRQNLANSKASSRNTSGYRGVVRAGNRWVAQVYYRLGRKRNNIRIGTFDDPLSAAKAYDKKVRELHGDFAYQNFPGGLTL